MIQVLSLKMCKHAIHKIFSSAVPRGSGAFQIPTCPSSSALSASASTLDGGRGNLRNASVILFLFWLDASLELH